MRTCGRKNVTMLIVALRFAFTLSRPVDSNYVLQEIISFFFSYLILYLKIRVEFCCHLIFHFKNLFQLHALSESVPQIAFRPFVFIRHCLHTSLLLLLFLSRNFGL